MQNEIHINLDRLNGTGTFQIAEVKHPTGSGGTVSLEFFSGTVKKHGCNDSQ